MRYKNLRVLFGDGPRADYLETILESAMKSAPKAIAKNRGTHVLAGISRDPKDDEAVIPIHLDDPIRTDQDGNSRLMVMFMGANLPEGEKASIRPGHVSLRVDMPLHFAYDREPLKEYSVYHIRFKISSDDPRFTEESVKPLQRGYIGITKRDIMTRLREHGYKAETNTGSLLHSVWHQLVSQGIAMHPVIQLSGCADTLGKVYALEEEAVAKYTLAPLGLNAIPGGMAGIRMMHQLRLLTSTRVGLAERDAAVERLQRGGFEHGSPCAHYRRGHYRKLPSERLTWVSPCWVNLKEVAAESEKPEEST
jgi:hypothetical protein